MIKVPRLPWLIAGMLFLSTLINYTARVTLSVVVGNVLREFSMTEKDYAQIVSLFLVAYAVMYAGSGYVVDRLGTRRGFTLFVSAWSAAQFVTGFVIGKWTLAASQFGLGLAEPGNFPAGVKTAQEWFPPQQRAAAVGIFNAGSSLGAALGAPMAAFLTVRYGWRSAFFFTGGLGFVWLVLWLIITPSPGSRRWIAARRENGLEDLPVESGADALKSKRNTFRLLRSRPCLMLILARFLTDPVIYFILFWLPRYLEKGRGFDIATVGKYAWVPFFFGGSGYIVGGWLSGRLMRAGWSLPRSRKTAMLVGACFMPAAMLAPLVPTAGLAIFAVSFVVFGHAVWVSNLLTLPADLFHSNEVATGSGFSGMGGSISGIVANLCTGYVVMRFSYQPIFLLAGLMHPLAIALIFWLLPDRDFPKAPALEVAPA
ncbi:MAG: MFS transporter [Acidobacteriota bacterium]|nr:MFS transporter [Acidobacteriota bacterium]